MPCKITTTWCQSEERCSAKIVKDGDPFIDPPASSLSPSNGAVYNLPCPVGTSSTVSSTVNWTFSDGQWKWTYNCNGSEITHKVYNATKIQKTKLQKICQNFSVCYKSNGECPGGSPLGTAAPGTFNDYSSWSAAVQSQADALGSTTTMTLPTLPITLSTESTTSVSNTGTGSSTPSSTTSSGASADCLSFDNPIETSNYPTSAPTTDSSTGPDFEALN